MHDHVATLEGAREWDGWVCGLGEWSKKWEGPGCSCLFSVCSQALVPLAHKKQMCYVDEVG